MSPETERHLKSLDALVDYIFRTYHEVAFHPTDIFPKFQKICPDATHSLLSMMKLLKNDNVLDEVFKHGNTGIVGDFILIQKPETGYYEAQLKKDERTKRDAEFIQASIDSANSVIKTNESIRINKVGRYALGIAVCSVIISIIDLFKTNEYKLQIISPQQSKIQKQPEKDSIKQTKPPPPYFYPPKKNP